MQNINKERKSLEAIAAKEIKVSSVLKAIEKAGGFKVKEVPAHDCMVFVKNGKELYFTVRSHFNTVKNNVFSIGENMGAKTIKKAIQLVEK